MINIRTGTTTLRNFFVVAERLILALFHLRGFVGFIASLFDVCEYNLANFLKYRSTTLNTTVRFPYHFTSDVHLTEIIIIITLSTYYSNI